MDDYSGGLEAGKTLNKPTKNLYIAEVVAVGRINPIPYSDKEKINRSTTRFNADPHAIRCVIVGAKMDGAGDYPNVMELPNCFPLMPKHTNIVPKVGEFVIVMLIGDDERFNDRFYIGPIISTATKLNEDTAVTALANFVDGTTDSTAEITPNGVYEDKQNVVIEGRDNTDIIQRSNEVLIRAGKFKLNEPLVFNNVNPGYVQIKSDFNITELDETTNKTVTKQGSVTNIVSDRINLLSYDGIPDFSSTPGGYSDLLKLPSEGGLTNVDKKGASVYIDDAKLEEILAGAHQLVFGDVLVEYLVLMRKALLNHCHNIDKPVDDSVKGENEVSIFEKKAKDLEKTMLSKNIRIN